ncbi:MAG: PLP-dependent aminotransferase family protein [Eubacteriales bacterium]|nr:PLP-dependent aminotransferase family protein [Eubacteriales bacterium]
MPIIKLDSNSGVPFYEQIYDAVKSEIVAGALKHGEKLPSKRCLATRLQCSLNTVQGAYSQLTAEGYINPRSRSGYYISKIDGMLNLEKSEEDEEAESSQDPAYRYDLTHHGIDSNAFPFSVWRRLTKESINEYDMDLHKTGESQGYSGLRSSISRYLRQSRGVKCSPQQIIISSGTEMLVQLLIQLFGEKSIYALEDPGYEKLNLIFKSNRSVYKAMPLDSEGILPQALRESGAHIAFTTPSHQFPTGTIMPINRRINLLQWAGESPERYIVEDDYDSEFKYGGMPVPSLHSLDTGDSTIYAGSFSKCLTPSIRISYMVLPLKLMEPYYSKLSFYVCPASLIEQKALCRFIDEGHFERHLNRMRNIYKKKRECLISAVRSEIPDAVISGANAGLHVLLTVRTRKTESEIVSAAAAKGVRIYGLSRFFSPERQEVYDARDRAAPGAPVSLLLGFASVDAADIPEAVRALRSACGR